MFLEIGGEMLKLSNEITERLNQSDSVIICNGPNEEISLFEGNSGKILESEGFLNFIIRRNNGSYAIEKNDFSKSYLKVINMPSMSPLNSSSVVSIGFTDKYFYAQHWDGFCTYFSKDEFDIIEQKFTK